MNRPTLPKLQPTLNPVITKELRSRMRGGRAFAILTAFLLVLSFVTYGLYRIVVSTSGFDPSGLLSARIGQTLFSGLAFLELFLILFITPALTAGTVSGEQEKLTYEMLLATPLKPRAILSGKLISAMSYVLLLIFAAVPLASLVFIFGGVAPADMLRALIVLVVTAFTWGIVGLFFSALTGRTVRATILSYSLLLLATAGSVFVAVVWGVVRQAEPPRALLFLNPFSAMASVMGQAVPSSGFLLGFPFAVLAGEWSLMRSPMQQPLIAGFRPTWHFTLALYAALSTVLYLISTQLVKPVRRWRIGRGGVVVVAACLLLFGAGGYVLFRSLAAEARLLATPTPSAPLLMPPAPPMIIERPVPMPAYPYPPPPPTATPTPAPPLAPPEE